MQNKAKVPKIQWKDSIKRGLYGFSVAIVSSFYPLVNQYREPLTNLTTFVDTSMHFNKYFIIPYVSWYAYVSIFIALLCIYDEENYFKLISSLVVTMLISFAIFIYFPTVMDRPIINGTDLFSKMVLSIYSADKPYNCLPSAHVSYSMVIAIYVAKSKIFSDKVKFWSSVVCVLIILSTIYVKQHYFLDGVTGVMLAYIVYVIIEILGDKVKEKRTKTNNK